MAAVTMPPSLLHSRSHHDLHPLTTLPDPRSSRPSPAHSRSTSISRQHHPDLTDEVASLSNKLITAINHQTTLDDTLSQTRHELDSAQERVRQLEAQVQKHDSLVADGILVNRKESEDNAQQLIADVAGEKKKRAQVEKEKKSMEVELESLTTALFEEANEMVSAARKERENVEKRNEQLRSQLKDTELLLASHQEQLAELKNVMQNIASERAEVESNTNGSIAPSTPAMQHQEKMNRVFEQLHISTDVPCEDIPPAPPTTFTHLLSPVLRTDLSAYNDFHTLLETSRKSAPSSRVNSGSYGTLNLAALANAHRDQTNILSNGSTSSLATSGTWQSSPGTPSTAPSSANSSVALRDHPISSAPLKETRFYKRVLTEDVEPTLRLDSAPGLSWLARRAVINSMCEGSLVVEPTPNTATLHHHACSLCGENRKGNEYIRTHRFRTSENENAQRYPLCEYCLNRLRSTCDFLGFLRIVKDGHWRTEGEQAEAVAWEESVRLRERMFWARVGGGVIPTFVRARDSPRSSVEETKSAASPTEERDVETAPTSPESASDDPFYTKDRTSVYSTTHEADGLGIADPSTQLQSAPPLDEPPSPAMTEDEATKQLHANLNAFLERESKESKAAFADDATIALTKSNNRESTTMPGAFEF